MAWIKPLPKEHTPELAEDFALFENILGFVPNSLLTMQRRPAIVKAFGDLTRAVMSPRGAVDAGFKRLLAHFASTASGCRYCQAHSLVAAELSGIDAAKLNDIWSYKTSALYNGAERAALDYALAAGSVPNTVDDELMQRMQSHWSDEQIVEILGAICLYGFLNRWNDSMATELEEGPLSKARNVLQDDNWDPGKHSA